MIRIIEYKRERRKKTHTPNIKMFNLQWHWFCVLIVLLYVLLRVCLTTHKRVYIFASARTRTHRRISEMKKWNFDRDKNSNATEWYWFVFAKRWWVTIRPQHTDTQSDSQTHRLSTANDSWFFLLLTLSSWHYYDYILFCNRFQWNIPWAKLASHWFYIPFGMFVYGSVPLHSLVFQSYKLSFHLILVWFGSFNSTLSMHCWSHFMRDQQNSKLCGFVLCMLRSFVVQRITFTITWVRYKCLTVSYKIMTHNCLDDESIVYIIFTPSLHQQTNRQMREWKAVAKDLTVYIENHTSHFFDLIPSCSFCFGTVLQA